ncbi:hypothetical protein DN068_07305 [Taibaiella soli]|uniref:Uncharacterized protein n=2 Tax=Taibaiella soli TaxID=1649169 RepID=A0A2W2ADK6_9BACT|nr:hypothetical protein DN068_07305 [Taibaiella soli]
MQIWHRCCGTLSNSVQKHTTKNMKRTIIIAVFAVIGLVTTMATETQAHPHGCRGGFFAPRPRVVVSYNSGYGYGGGYGYAAPMPVPVPAPVYYGGGYYNHYHNGYGRGYNRGYNNGYNNGYNRGGGYGYRR